MDHQVPLNGQVLAVVGDVLIAVLKSLADIACISRLVLLVI